MVRAARVEGTGRTPDRRNAQTQAALDFTQPPVRVEASLVACVDTDGRQDHLLVLVVPPSGQLHATHRDEVLLRVGDESRRLEFVQRRELAYDKSQAHFDGMRLPGVGLEDLDALVLERYRDEVGASDLEHTMKGVGLLGRDGVVTAGAYLLFAATPQDRFPEAYVRVLRYRGRERGTGARQQLSDDIRCGGPVPTMLERAIAEVRRLVPTRRALDLRVASRPSRSCRRRRGSKAWSTPWSTAATAWEATTSASRCSMTASRSTAPVGSPAWRASTTPGQ